MSREEQIKKVFSDNLKRLLSERNKRQIDLANYLSVSGTTVNNWVNGYKMPRMDKIDKICSFFVINRTDLLNPPSPENKGSTIRSVRIPVLGTVVAGIPMEAIENIIDYEEIPEEMARGKEFFALRVKGRSMEPKFLEDDIVIVQKTSTVDSGDIAIVLVNGDEATMKKVMRSPEGVTLIAYNPDVYEPHFYSNHDIVTKPVEVIGKVVEIRRKV